MGDLVKWKNQKQRKPLILWGARQVGKTWLLKEFGSREYSNVAYINCDEIPAMAEALTDFNHAQDLKNYTYMI
jgi:predicted AAA+ superfamily ATPase